MNITLKELLSGKATVIKNKNYFETQRYVQPFIDRMSEITKDFVIHVKMPDQMTFANNNTDVTFNRVSIQAILPSKIGDYNEVIGFCYALDVRKPVAKFYRAYVNKETGIMLAFNPLWQMAQAIEPEEPLSYSDVKKLMELTDDTNVKIEKLESMKVTRDELNSTLGSWVRKCRNVELYSEFGKVKLAASNAIDAFEMLFEDRDSDYFCDETVEVNKFDCFEALAQTIANDEKDLINKFDKTILISNIL